MTDQAAPLDREAITNAAYQALRAFKMGNMCQEDDHHAGYPLVDLCSRPDGDIRDGEDQIGDMAAAVADAILAAPISFTPKLGDALTAAGEVWHRFFYPQHGDFVKACGCMRNTGVPMKMADRLRELMNAVQGRAPTDDPRPPEREEPSRADA